MSKDQYTHGHQASVVTAHATRTAEDCCGYLLPHLRPGMRILDIGCGPGSITIGLANHVAPSGQVTGLDVSEPVLEMARELARSRGDDQTRFVRGDVYHLDYPSNSFDIAHAHQVLQHLSDPVAALKEMARVVGPGGLIAVRDADYAAMSWFPRLPGLDRWNDLYHQVTRANRAEADAARYLRGWTNAAGFREVNLSVGTWLYASPEAVSWWGKSWAERVVDSSFAEQALAAGITTETELAEVSEAWLAFSEHPDAWFCVPNGEAIIQIP